jgi:hypothetical protein
MTRSNYIWALCISTCFATSAWAASQQGGKSPMALDDTPTMTSESTTVSELTPVAESCGYRQVNDFFNVREANADLKQCKWSFEIASGWSTYYGSQHRDDDMTLAPRVRYGVTDELYVGLEVLPINFGDGWDGTGNGDLEFQVFYQFLKECDMAPAMAIWAETRIPTGVGSEKMDVSLHMAVTKTICDNFRAHVNGYVESANGYHGDPEVDSDRRSVRNGLGRNGEDSDDRRNFQWGAGPGLDYKVNECNMVVLNYLNKSNNYYGHQNNNIVELGWVYSINECQHLKVAVDAECHKEAGGPHWSARVQYAIEW